MAEHKTTTDRKQVWTFVGILVLACAFFGYAVLPHMDPGNSRLRGEQSPDFTLRVISGGEPGNRWALSDQRGRVVVLDFWASWCAPCRTQAPILEKFAAKHADDDVAVIGVNTGDVEPAAMEFIRSVGITYPVVFDEQGLVSRAFGAQELPTLVVITPSGKVSSIDARIVREAELEQLVQQARNSR